MTDFPSYTLGTVSVSNGDIAIVGDGTIWTGINARAGDTIVIGTSRALVVDVTDDTHLKIDAWPFTTVTAGTSYKIIQNSPLRFVGGQAMADVSSLIAVLRANGLLWYLPDGYTDPNDIVPALTADDGQGILRISTGALWVMSGGTWVAAGTYKGFQYKGAYNPATAYVANDVLTSGGSTYIVTAATTGNAPPNASYYDVFASKGDTGTMTVGTVTTGAGGSSAAVTNSGTSTAAILDFTIPAGKTYSATSTTSLAIGTGSKAFTTQSGLAYTNGARVRASSAANTTNWMEGLVTYSGTTLTMTSDKTNGSGTHTDWNLNVVGEPGAGDLTSANNLSDLANASTALTNLGGTTVGKAVFTAADAAAARAAIGTPVSGYTADKRYYVSTAGNDSNDGLGQGSAFLTLQTAVNAANPNGTVYVGAGTYTLSAAIDMKPGVRIIGTPGTVITQGSAANLTTLLDFATSSAHGASIIGCTIDGNRANNSNDFSGADSLALIWNTNSVVIKDCNLINSTGYGILIQDGADCVIDNNVVDNLLINAIWINSSSTVISTKAIISRNKISRWGQHGITALKGSNNVIRNNILTGTLTYVSVSKTGATVTRTGGASFTSDMVGRFLVANGGTELLITAFISSTQVTVNIATGDFGASAGVVGQGDQISIGASSNNDIYNNTVSSGASLGISIFSNSDGNAVANSIHNNTLQSVASAAVSIQVTANQVIDTSITGNMITSPGIGGLATPTVAKVGVYVSGGASLTGVLVSDNVIVDYAGNMQYAISYAVGMAGKTTGTNLMRGFAVANIENP